MTWEEQIDAAPSIEAKLRVIGVALDWIDGPPDVPATKAKKAVKDSARSLGQRHLQSVDTRRVFEHWVKVHGMAENTTLTADRRQKIATRLKEGYSVEDLCRAVDGCARSDFHMGREHTTGGRKFNDLTVILRTGSQVEKFIALGMEGKRRDNAFLDDAA